MPSALRCRSTIELQKFTHLCAVTTSATIVQVIQNAYIFCQKFLLLSICCHTIDCLAQWNAWPLIIGDRDYPCPMLTCYGHPAINMEVPRGSTRLLDSPSLMVLGLSVGCETWPPIGWHCPFVIGWSSYMLGLAPLQRIWGWSNRWEFPPLFKGHWQSPFTAITAGRCLLLGLWKETVKQSRRTQPSDPYHWPLAGNYRSISDGVLNIVRVLPAPYQTKMAPTWQTRWHQHARQWLKTDFLEWKYFN